MIDLFLPCDGQPISCNIRSWRHKIYHVPTFSLNCGTVHAYGGDTHGYRHITVNSFFCIFIWLNGLEK